MNVQADERWGAFRAINDARRAIRDFDGRPVPDEIVRELLAEAMLAPSSSNMQGYQLHWVRDAHTKAALANACNTQRAAVSAATLIAVVAGRDAAMRSIASMRRYVETTDGLDAQSKQYHAKALRSGRSFMQIAALPLWNPLKALLCLLFPSLTLIPIGPSGMRHWMARSSLYAAQTLLLAASAHGIDSCPMEGFSPSKVARVLDLPRGSVIPLIIALGYRRPDARVEPRWRRRFDEAVVIH
jgi:nitroreductase